MVVGGYRRGVGAKELNSGGEGRGVGKVKIVFSARKSCLPSNS